MCISTIDKMYILLEIIWIILIPRNPVSIHYIVGNRYASANTNNFKPKFFDPIRKQE